MSDAPAHSLGSAALTPARQGPVILTRRIKLALIIPEAIERGLTAPEIAALSGVSTLAAAKAINAVARVIEEMPAVATVGLRSSADIAFRRMAAIELRDLEAFAVAREAGEDVDPTRLRNCLARIKALMPMIRGERTQADPLGDDGSAPAAPQPEAENPGERPIATRY